MQKINFMITSNISVITFSNQQGAKGDYCCPEEGHLFMLSYIDTTIHQMCEVFDLKTLIYSQKVAAISFYYLKVFRMEGCDRRSLL